MEAFARSASGGRADVEVVVSSVLTRGLKLDRGNAGPDALGEAFSRLGLRWWPELTSRDERTEGREQTLRRLIRARNAIAHARLHELDLLRAEGYPINLETIRNSRRSLNALCGTMDQVLASHLGALLDEPEPW